MEAKILSCNLHEEMRQHAINENFGIEVARMAGLPDAVVERAQEIADALSGEADVEARVPLRKKMPKRPAAERQLPLLS